MVASTCRGTGVATGFWVDDSSIVTSYYGVAEAVALAVLDEDGDPVPVSIKGTSPSTGVAVLTPEGSYAPPPLPLGGDATPGEWLATLELPDKTLDVHEPEAAQLVSTEATLTQRGTTHTGLNLLPGSADVSSAGAPMIDATGNVRGMLLTAPNQFQRSIVPVSQIREALRSPRSEDEGSCSRPTGPHSMTTVDGDPSSAVRRTLEDYFGGINAANYRRAYNALGPRFHGSGSSLSGIEKGWISTYDFNIQVREVSGSTRTPTAWVTFDSIFEQGRGPEKQLSCARWSIDYTFVRDGSRLKINRSRSHGNTERSYTEC